MRADFARSARLIQSAESILWTAAVVLFPLARFETAASGGETLTALWDDEAARYRAMNENERRQWLARLLFTLTVFARGTYTVGADGLDNPARMRRFNELMHRTASQLRDHLESSPGRPDEVFLRIVGEEIAVLNIAVADVLGRLRP